MSGTPPRVSAIVTACDDSPPLRRLLASLRGQADALGAELLLVVNAPPETLPQPTREALEALVDRLIFEPRVGKSNALNRAIDESRGEVLAFTDDDAEPDPGWLVAITRPLLCGDRPPERVGCGGPVEPVFDHEATPDWVRAMVLGRSSHFLGPHHDLGEDPRDYASQFGADVPLGANCAYRREVFERYRYDPALGPNRATGLRGGEDFVMAQQLIAAGHTLRYEPSARVRHPMHAERCREPFVLDAYRVQGIESVLIARALGRTARLDPRKPRRALRKQRARRLWRRLCGGLRLSEADRLAFETEAAYQRGRLCAMTQPEYTASVGPGGASGQPSEQPSSQAPG